MSTHPSSAVFVLVLFPTSAFSLEKPISGLAPEFQEAAQKRRAEIARQTFCNEKAAREKVMKRDLASFVVGCMDEVEKAEQAIKKWWSVELTYFQSRRSGAIE